MRGLHHLLDSGGCGQVLGTRLNYDLLGQSLPVAGLHKEGQEFLPGRRILYTNSHTYILPVISGSSVIAPCL